MAADLFPAEIERLERAGRLLLEAEDRLPVLRTIAWERRHADAFFAAGERELPRPDYPRIDPEPSLERVAEARRLIDGDSPVHAWLLRLTETMADTARLLAATGTAGFHTYSRRLYGDPASPIADGRRTALDLARRLDDVLADFEGAAVRLEPPEQLSARDLKARLDAELPAVFAGQAPRVEVTLDVSAKAAAGRDYIKLRADAVFSDLDVTQLLHHEAYIHIATSRNGLQQARFPILAESHPGNARTQEGLAVFAEFISGALDPRRFRRLADRVIAIDMAANGADFLELYRFFRERNAPDRPIEAFESARRVVRGGLVGGGAPFTKDSVYLGGLLEVHNYLRTAVRAGDPGLIRLLFAGKMDLADLGAMKQLREAGLISEPAIMPPWARDLRYLLSYLAYSTFLNEIDLAHVAARYEHLFADD
ncbi:flavohemoglobin expression-modulating QEGLA motif protein [Maricaulis sp.]|uniref:flavohemoglobin expression-modulating QEGLA motif protein n=1 Tax=Maricaulis sp. TaxID=1486257 RepID=UPI00260C7584|nr:flavohemoglobin expression-modulating QEGLA motif protein [Maricaulis sp.]